MPVPRDPPLTPEAFKAILKAKGWRNVGLAARWDKSVQWISTLIQDPGRPPQYDDAVRGLPRLSKAQQHALAKERADARAQTRLRCPPVGAQGSFEEVPDDLGAPRPAAGGYRYRGLVVLGDILAATDNFGSVVTEGERAIVVEVTDTGAEERYGLLFENGHFARFTPEHIDLHLATTGLVDDQSVSYVFEGEARLRRDLDAGRFTFHEHG